MIKTTCEFAISPDVSTREKAVVRTDAAGPGDWHTTYQIRLQVPNRQVHRIVLTTQIPCQCSWYLSPGRQLVPLRTNVFPPFPVGRFVVVQTNEGLFKFDFPWAARFSLNSVGDAVEVEATVQNKWGSGLLRWGGALLGQPKGEMELEVHQDRLASIKECMWVEPYPEGALSAVCLTDHADFDSLENMPLLVDLLVKHDFRITKSVFPITGDDQVIDRSEPGLDQPEYRRHIAKLHEHGSEIAYHGLGPRKETPPLEECVRRAELVLEFSPKTFIDHGWTRYAFARGGRLADGSSLSEFLKPYGVVNYWSFTDLWHNPFRSLATFAPRAEHDMLADLVSSCGTMRHWWRRPATGPYLATHALRNLLGRYGLMEVRKAPLHRRSWSFAANERRQRLQLIRQPLVIYGRDATSFACNQDKLWIFDTILLNHLGLQLSPARIDRLAEASELLLCHCYLGSQREYISGNCLEGSRENPRIAAEFRECVEYLAYRQREAAVISLPFHALRESLESFATTRIIRNRQGWSIKAPRPHGGLVVAGDCQTLKACGAPLYCCRGNLGFIRLDSSAPVDVLLGSDCGPVGQ